MTNERDSDRSPAPPHLVLIHGAWAGPWVWDTITETLEDSGLCTHAVTVPGVGPWDPREGDLGLDDLVASVVGQIADLPGPIVLVGHSGGGIIATQVAEQIRERIAGIAFVAGMMLPTGLTYRNLCDDLKLTPPVGINGYLQPTADGRGSVVAREAGAAIFFHLAPPQDAITAARRLAPQMDSARQIAPTWTAERFGTLPRLYIEALHDRSLPILAQRRMQALSPGADIVTLAADHAPQLSQPAELAGALVSFAATVTVGTHTHEGIAS
ncbi:alpha/beta fold hydrolase [Gordonia polyisoprenivorans]|uniref:alpha/beta fold hydrolase n=1 Tax=Gordonia polyisoprenivorans TaxID=84595 RepID=UPI000B99F2EC|nr:alpha/beta fold hydrolase [Gordonia polyisoprenivorans]OZC33579.1 esterase [Gordonia polyisoprenivorans]UZF56995.1 alpha/beta fold hydrolase [Gordonia polyisoprenivorans]